MIERWFVDCVCANGCPHYWSVGWAKTKPRAEVCVYQRTQAKSPVQIESTKDGIPIEDLSACPDVPRAARARTGV